MLVLGTYHLVNDVLTPEKGVEILFLLEHVHFQCRPPTPFGKLILVLGKVLCLVKPINTKTKKITAACEQELGDSREVVYRNEKGTEVKMGLNALLTSGDDKNYGMSGELGERK